MPEDFLSKIQAEVRARLRELDGVVAEYERLRAAAGALGLAVASGRPSPRSAGRDRSGSAPRGGRTAPRSPRGRRAPAGERGRTRAASASARTGRPARGRVAGRRRKRAPRGANRDAILKALSGSSGGTGASELAKRAGVGRVSTYQVLTRLEAEQLVRREQPANGPALYSLR